MDISVNLIEKKERPDPRAGRDWSYQAAEGVFDTSVVRALTPFLSVLRQGYDIPLVLSQRVTFVGCGSSVQQDGTVDPCGAGPCMSGAACLSFILPREGSRSGLGVTQVSVLQVWPHHIHNPLLTFFLSLKLFETEPLFHSVWCED